MGGASSGRLSSSGFGSSGGSPPPPPPVVEYGTDGAADGPKRRPLYFTPYPAPPSRQQLARLNRIEADNEVVMAVVKKFLDEIGNQ